jgi:hypothetical protein
MNTLVNATVGQPILAAAAFPRGAGHSDKLTP